MTQPQFAGHKQPVVSAARLVASKASTECFTNGGSAGGPGAGQSLHLRRRRTGARAARRTQRASATPGVGEQELGRGRREPDDAEPAVPSGANESEAEARGGRGHLLCSPRARQCEDNRDEEPGADDDGRVEERERGFGHRIPRTQLRRRLGNGAETHGHHRDDDHGGSHDERTGRACPLDRRRSCQGRLKTCLTPERRAMFAVGGRTGGSDNDGVRRQIAPVRD